MTRSFCIFTAPQSRPFPEKHYFPIVTVKPVGTVDSKIFKHKIPSEAMKIQEIYVNVIPIVISEKLDPKLVGHRIPFESEQVASTEERIGGEKHLRTI